MGGREPMHFLRKIKAHILFFFCFILLCACEVSYKEAIGNYKLQYSHGIERLELHADATYLQTYVNASNGKTFTRIGEWKLDTKFQLVELENAMAVNKIVGFADTVPIENPDQNGGLIQLPVRNRWGTIVLVDAGDLNLYYVKK